MVIPVLLEIESGVAKITLNEPESLNSLSTNIIEGLEKALERIEADSNIRSAILTGNGKGFCVGGNIKQFPKNSNALAVKDWMRTATKLVLKINRIEKPIIAAVNGYAMGAGFSLALATDIIIASEESTFGMVFNKIGAVPDMGAHYFLPRIVGLHKAKYLMFTGQKITASEAMQHGIIMEACAKDNLTTRSQEIASALAESATASIGLTKNILNRSFEMTIEQVLNEEALFKGLHSPL